MSQWPEWLLSFIKHGSFFKNLSNLECSPVLPWGKMCLYLFFFKEKWEIWKVCVSVCGFKTSYFSSCMCNFVSYLWCYFSFCWVQTELCNLPQVSLLLPYRWANFKVLTHETASRHPSFVALHSKIVHKMDSSLTFLRKLYLCKCPLLYNNSLQQIPLFFPQNSVYSVLFKEYILYSIKLGTLELHINVT